MHYSLFEGIYILEQSPQSLGKGILIRHVDLGTIWAKFRVTFEHVDFERDSIVAENRARKLISRKVAIDNAAWGVNDKAFAVCLPVFPKAEIGLKISGLQDP